ncbi:MAG: hypothetical protein ACOY3P_05840, partial [Planctomycetota bacterium]
EAKKVVLRMGVQAAERAEPQTMTLLRFTHAGRIDRETQPDLLDENVNRQEFVDDLKTAVEKMEVSQLSAGPIEALKAVGQLLGEGTGERRIVYLLTDFRLRDWNDPTDVHKLLEELKNQEVDIHLVNCVDTQRPNLAITALEPAEGIQAAGVPYFMEVTVQNFGEAAVREVPVQLEEDGHARPAAIVPDVPAGQAVKERFLVNFPTAGEHQITARLEGDAVAIDNVRYSLAKLPPDVPVLLVDGDVNSIDARFVSVACSPGGAVRTGLRPQIETTRYLSIKSPDEFAAINLMNIDTLDRTAIEALEQFVKNGGGVAMFLSERTPARFVNDELYRDGAGFFPLPLKAPAELFVDRLERAADVDVEDHFIFRVFADPRNPFLSGVVISRYFSVPEGWTPQPDSGVEVLARLRTGAPLVIERRYGEGRVIAFLTTAGPAWNNWARNPSFVVMIQDLQAYLAQRTAEDAGRPVGMPLEVAFDGSQYQPAVRFFAPDDQTGAPVDGALAGSGQMVASYLSTDRAGYYQYRLTRNDGTPETGRFALNVDSAEGDLAIIDNRELASKLPGIDFVYEQATAVQYAATDLAGVNLGPALLYALLGLLLVEQIVAWSASYHPAARMAGAKGGGR